MERYFGLGIRRVYKVRLEDIKLDKISKKDIEYFKECVKAEELALEKAKKEYSQKLVEKLKEATPENPQYYRYEYEEQEICVRKVFGRKKGVIYTDRVLFTRDKPNNYFCVEFNDWELVGCDDDIDLGDEITKEEYDKELCYVLKWLNPYLIGFKYNE